MHKGKSAFSPAIPRAFQVTQETGAPRAELIRGSWAKRPLDWKIKKISPSYNAKTGLGSDGNKSCGFPWERALQLRPLWDAFPLFSAPHAGMRQRRFCLPDKRHHRKTPSVRQTGAGGYVARLAAAPAAGMLSPSVSASSAGMRQRRFCLPHKRHHRKAPGVRQTEGRALCRVFCGRARRGGAPSLASAPRAGMCQRRFCLPHKRHHRKAPGVRQTGAGGYVARLAAAPAAGMLSPCFLLQVPDCANVIFCLPGAALKGACGPRR